MASLSRQTNAARNTRRRERTRCRPQLEPLEGRALLSRNLALNTSGGGLPSPLESDRGWGGGSYPWHIVDGRRSYSSWANGLAFTGGRDNWGGQPGGPRQATINLGRPGTFDQVVVWWHGQRDTPQTTALQYFNGTSWLDLPAQRVYGRFHEEGSGSGSSDSDEYFFSPVTGTKVRVGFNNLGASIDGSPMVHGWIYEFEVFGELVPDLAPTAIARNPSLGGVDFSYRVADAPLPTTTVIGVYWARGETLEDRMGAPLFFALTETDIGTHGPVHVPAELLGTAPAEATHVLVVADPVNVIEESSETNNVRALALRYEEFTINVTTFIPGNYVPGPLQPWPGSFCQGFLEPLALVYAGDDRDFDPHAGSFRTRQMITVIPDQVLDADGVKEGTEYNAVGPTFAFAEDALLDGVIDYKDFDAELYDCHRLHNVGIASTDGMFIEVTRVGAWQVSVRLHTPLTFGYPLNGGPSNPFVPGSSELSFSIDWDFTVTLDTSRMGVGAPTWSVQGVWDGFPAVEIYINDYPIYLNSPGSGPYDFWTDLVKLLAGYGDESVARSGTLSGGGPSSGASGPTSGGHSGYRTTAALVGPVRAPTDFHLLPACLAFVTTKRSAAAALWECAEPWGSTLFDTPLLNHLT